MGIGRRKKGDLMQSSQCAFHRRSLPVNSLPARANGYFGFDVSALERGTAVYHILLCYYIGYHGLVGWHKTLQQMDIT